MSGSSLPWNRHSTSSERSESNRSSSPGTEAPSSSAQSSSPSSVRSPSNSFSGVGASAMAQQLQISQNGVPPFAAILNISACGEYALGFCLLGGSLISP